MQNKLERAKQFLPFDALNGFKEAILEVQKRKIDKANLSCEQIFDIDFKLRNIKIGNKLKVKYYYDLDYVETIGIIKKINSYKHIIVVENSIISFDDILDIEIL